MFNSNDHKGKLENLKGFAIMQKSNPYQQKSAWNHHAVYVAVALVAYVIAAHMGVV